MNKIILAIIPGLLKPRFQWDFSADSPLTQVTPGHVGLSLGHVVGLRVVHSMGTLPGEIRNLQAPAATNLTEICKILLCSVNKRINPWTNVDATVATKLRKS